jgi:hypothetical protein
MGGGKQPQPPQLDPRQSAELYERQLQLQRQYLPSMTATAGTAARGQDAEAVRFGLGMLTNPGATVYSQQISGAQKRLSDARALTDGISDWQSSGSAGIFGVAPAGMRYNPTSKKWITDAEYNKLRSDLPNRIKKAEADIKRFQSRDPVAELRRALPQEFAARDRLLGQINAAQKTSGDFNNYQNALRRGLQAQTVTAQQTDAGALGNRLMSEAMAKMDQGGRLSPEAERDAVQSARQGMAARGLATGSGGLAAELLNRDAYSRQREFQNLGFAQGVQTQDLQRRQANTLLRADANVFNANMRSQTNQANLGFLGQAAQNMDMERARQLSLGQDAYNFGLSTNPRMMLAGLGSPYANMTGNAMQMVSGARGLDPMYSGGQFSGQGGFNMMGAGMGALGGAATGAMIGGAFGGVGAIPGALLGGVAGAAGGGMSDKREKTDIKKIDGPTNVIGIPSYEYRYKGEKKKRRGVMAQDVQKVLPEAVAEVDYKGKKRLAIKPAVIGAALAEHLAADTKPVALAV